MKTSRFAAALVFLAFSGATCFATEHYRVEVIYFPQGNILPDNDSPSKGKLSFTLVDPKGERASRFNAKLNDPTVPKVVFPRLDLESGVTGMANDQKPFSYADTFDTAGNPTHFSTHKVGPTLTATVTPGESAETLTLVLLAENPRFSGYVTPPGSSEKQAVFALERLGPTSGGIRKGYWALMTTGENAAYAYRVTSVTP